MRKKVPTMTNTAPRTNDPAGNVTPNLNVSRAPVSEPKDYHLADPQVKREAITLTTMYAASVLLVILGATLGGAAYMLQHPGFDVQGALRAKLPGLAREKPDSQISRDAQSTLEGKYAAMDAAYARKEFPDELFASDYVKVSAQGSAENLSTIKERTRGMLAATLSFKEETQVAQVTLTAPDTALVAITQNHTLTAPLTFYAAGTPRPGDAAEHVVQTLSFRAVDTWKRDSEGTWKLKKETVLAEGRPRRRVEADTDAWGTVSTEAERPEETPEKNQIEALYHALDEQRMHGQFPTESYVTDWKGTDTQGAIHSLAEATQALTALTSACEALEFSTQLDDFMLTSATHAFAKVTRRVSLRGTRDRGGDETATRREADTWRLEGNAWRVESTQQLSSSALWNYRENLGPARNSTFGTSSSGTDAPRTPLTDEEIRSLMTTRLVTEADLQGRSVEEITFIKNEPFAQRGYIFGREFIADHFATKPWYRPSTRALPELRGVEAKNVEFIGKYQDARGLHIPRPATEPLGSPHPES